MTYDVPKASTGLSDAAPCFWYRTITRFALQTGGGKYLHFKCPNGHICHYDPASYSIGLDSVVKAIACKEDGCDFKDDIRLLDFRQGLD